MHSTSSHFPVIKIQEVQETWSSAQVEWVEKKIVQHTRITFHKIHLNINNPWLIAEKNVEDLWLNRTPYNYTYASTHLRLFIVFQHDANPSDISNEMCSLKSTVDLKKRKKLHVCRLIIHTRGCFVFNAVGIQLAKEIHC